MHHCNMPAQKIMPNAAQIGTITSPLLNQYQSLYDTAKFPQYLPLWLHPLLYSLCSLTSTICVVLLLLEHSRHIPSSWSLHVLFWWVVPSPSSLVTHFHFLAGSDISRSLGPAFTITCNKCPHSSSCALPSFLPRIYRIYMIYIIYDIFIIIHPSPIAM